jgi:hypothetical protein
METPCPLVSRPQGITGAREPNIATEDPRYRVRADWAYRQPRGTAGAGAGSQGVSESEYPRIFSIRPRSAFQAQRRTNHRTLHRGVRQLDLIETMSTLPYGPNGFSRQELACTQFPTSISKVRRLFRPSGGALFVVVVSMFIPVYPAALHSLRAAEKLSVLDPRAERIAPRRPASVLLAKRCARWQRSREATARSRTSFTICVNTHDVIRRRTSSSSSRVWSRKMALRTQSQLASGTASLLRRAPRRLHVDHFRSLVAEPAELSQVVERDPNIGTECILIDREPKSRERV